MRTARRLAAPTPYPTGCLRGPRASDTPCNRLQRAYHTTSTAQTPTTATRPGTPSHPHTQPPSMGIHTTFPAFSPPITPDPDTHGQTQAATRPGPHPSTRSTAQPAPGRTLAQTPRSGLQAGQPQLWSKHRPEPTATTGGGRSRALGRKHQPHPCWGLQENCHPTQPTPTTAKPGSGPENSTPGPTFPTPITTHRRYHRPQDGTAAGDTQARHTTRGRQHCCTAAPTAEACACSVRTSSPLFLSLKQNKKQQRDNRTRQIKGGGPQQCNQHQAPAAQCAHIGKQAPSGHGHRAQNKQDVHSGGQASQGARETTDTYTPRVAEGQGTTNHAPRVGRTGATQPTHRADSRSSSTKTLVRGRPGCIRDDGKCHPET